MRVSSYILTMALLAGLAAAQTAPASQTVKTNPQQQPAKPATTTTKSVAKSPFAPKAKAAAAPRQSARKQTPKAPQAESGKEANASPAKTANRASQPAGAQTKVAPTPVKSAAANTQAVKKEVAKREVAKKEVANKQQPKTPLKTAVPVQAKAEPKPAQPEPKPSAPAVAQSEPVKLPSPGKRDPFLSPLVGAGARGPSNCTTGKRCLVVDQIVLKGVVQMRNGNLALVENAGKRPYVLHENDALFNGSVVKITGDSVTFREESSDILGRPVSREVVKKVTAPSV